MFEVNDVGLIHLIIMIKVNGLPLRFVLDQQVAGRQVLVKLVLGPVVNQLVACPSLANGQQDLAGRIIMVDKSRRLLIRGVLHRDGAIRAAFINRTGGHRRLIRRVARHYGAGYRSVTAG